MNTLSVDALSARPGQKVSGYVSVDVGVAAVPLPIVLVNGSRPGPRLTVLTGIHYGEFIGIEALREVIRLLDPAQVSGQLVACPLAMPPALYAQRYRVSPLDGLDPNRVFPGHAQGKPTERQAAWIFENLIVGADAYLDLHGGGATEDLAPFVAYRATGNADFDRTTLALAQAFGWQSIVRGGAPDGGNTHAAATRAGVPSLLIEIGSAGSRSPQEVAQVRDGLLRVMHHLGMLETGAPGAAAAIDYWRWWGEVTAPIQGLWYPEVAVGAEVAEGACLGRIVDPLGDERAAIPAPASGKNFYGERGLAIECGGVLAAIAMRDESPG